MDRRTAIPWLVVVALVATAIIVAYKTAALEISFVIALLAFSFYLLAEHQKRPRISLRVQDPPSDSFRPAIQKDARFLHVLVLNEPLGVPWSFFLRRDIAWLATARIAFYHPGARSPVFDPFDGRWSESPEPFTPAVAEGSQVELRDLSKIVEGRRANIPPGQASPLLVALKVDDDSEAYGFATESYWAQKTWRRPEWELEEGSYEVEITVRVGDIEYPRVFSLVNSGSRFTGLNWTGSARGEPRRRLR